MKRNAHVLFLSIVLLSLIITFTTGAALASDFEFVAELIVSPAPPPPPFGIGGIDRVGDQWFMANLDDGWNVYDQNFNQVGTTTALITNLDSGLVYDSNAGTVFLISANTIYECSTEGTVLNSFPSTGTALTALAFNPENDHIFAVHFLGYVAELTRGGSFIGSFTLSGNYWSGAAYDAGQGTLLLMTSNDDQVAEYMTDGTLVGMPLAQDCVSGNGLGLAYDSNTGFLTATGQSGSIGIWQRQLTVGTENVTWGTVKSSYR